MNLNYFLYNFIMINNFCIFLFSGKSEQKSVDSDDSKRSRRSSSGSSRSSKAETMKMFLDQQQQMMASMFDMFEARNPHTAAKIQETTYGFETAI